MLFRDSLEQNADQVSERRSADRIPRASCFKSRFDLALDPSESPRRSSPEKISNRFLHRQPGPITEIDLLTVIRNHFGTANLLCDAREHFFRQVHQVGVIAVRLIELEHREFGIVPRRNPLIPEMRFRSYTRFSPPTISRFRYSSGAIRRYSVHIQRIVMRLERLRQGAAGDGMQNRRFDFKISALVQKPPQFANDQTPLHENIANFAIHDKIHIALPVPDLDILKSVPFLGQRKKAFREKHEFGCKDSQFAGTRAEQRSFDADEVADIEQLVELEVSFRKLILLRVGL